VLDLRKRLERFSAHALSWRIGREEIRKLCFEINKLLVEPVVLAIADDGCSVLVIQLVVLANFLSQLRHVFLGFGSIHRSFHDTSARNLGNFPAMLAGNMLARAGNMPALLLIDLSAAFPTPGNSIQKGSASILLVRAGMLPALWKRNGTVMPLSI
jgi:hypothetical protein